MAPPQAPPPKPSSATPARSARIHLPADQRLLAGGLAGAVAVILILVLALSGGGSSSSPTTTPASSRELGSSKATNTTPTNSSLTGAVLKPVDSGGNAKRVGPVRQDQEQGCLRGGSAGSGTVRHGRVLCDLAGPLTDVDGADCQH